MTFLLRGGDDQIVGIQFIKIEPQPVAGLCDHRVGVREIQYRAGRNALQLQSGSWLDMRCGEHVPAVLVCENMAHHKGFASAHSAKLG